MTNHHTNGEATDRADARLWGDLSDLCKKTRHLLYGRKQKSRAQRYAERLERALQSLPENDLAILREEGLALLSELHGEIDKAIVHRKREIQLTERLHKEARNPKYAESTRAYMLQGRDAASLDERRVILAALVDQSKTIRRRAAPIS